MPTASPTPSFTAAKADGILASGPSRLCGFCRQPACLGEDTAELRTYECAACPARETILKSEKSGWWYAGWKRADGAALRAPTTGEMNAGKYGWQAEASA